ncbi:MAG TPA: DUF3048 domain-containing protein [Acidimicrobiales bacterium]|nr:DUF3048 domain-containing protein [Acidimicrobiales bacterium]
MPDTEPPTGSDPEGTPGTTPDSPPPPGPPRSGAAAPGPAILSRQELRRQSGSRESGSSRTWWYVLGAVAVVLIGTVATVALTGKTTPKAAPAMVTTTSAAAVPGAPCPLTGAPAPGGTVPARPALGVKIGNYPNDRPSAGLNQADIVFEEPVEGAITRLVAVFQCQGAALVGDVRSARQPDAGILSQLSNPLFVHAGGINPVIALLAASHLIDKNLYTGSNGSAIIQQPGRVAPFSTFVSTSTLWALAPSNTSPPAPIFTYSATLPSASVKGSGVSVHIPFSSSSDVTWQWSPSAGKYLRFYGLTPDKLLNGSQTTASDVVIMSVPTAIGSWVENSEGGHEVDVTATGSGPLVVMRNGAAIAGTWSRATLAQPATLTASNGTPITLQPGNTWEELVPDGIAVTPSAAPSATSGN